MPIMWIPSTHVTPMLEHHATPIICTMLNVCFLKCLFVFWYKKTTPRTEGNIPKSHISEGTIWNILESLTISQ